MSLYADASDSNFDAIPAFVTSSGFFGAAVESQMVNQFFRISLISDWKSCVTWRFFSICFRIDSNSIFCCRMISACFSTTDRRPSKSPADEAESPSSTTRGGAVFDVGEVPFFVSLFSDILTDLSLPFDAGGMSPFLITFGGPGFFSTSFDISNSLGTKIKFSVLTSTIIITLF